MVFEFARYYVQRTVCKISIWNWVHWLGYLLKMIADTPLGGRGNQSTQNVFVIQALSALALFGPEQWSPVIVLVTMYKYTTEDFSSNTTFYRFYSHQYWSAAGPLPPWRCRLRCAARRACSGAAPWTGRGTPPRSADSRSPHFWNGEAFVYLQWTRCEHKWDVNVN